MLTIDQMPLECAVLQESPKEYYFADSLNTLFEIIPETCIVEFLREAGVFWYERSDILYDILVEPPPNWCNLLTSSSPQALTI